MSDYLLLQIVFPDGSIYRFPAGGTIEMEIENALAERLVAKGVGVFRNQKHVKQDFHEAFKEVMRDFKKRVANGN